MPQTPTPNLKLKRPLSDGSETYNVQADLNDNWDKLDAGVGAQPVTSSTRPASAYNGKLIRETDTLRVYISNGTLPGSASFTTQLLAAEARTLGGPNARLVKVGFPGDTEDRLHIEAEGELWFGSGSATPDTVLYRNAANQLRTNDDLIVDGNLSVGGAGQRAIVVRSVDEAITSDATVNADGNLTYPLAANARYHIEVFGNIQGTAGDFKTSWTVPAGATGTRYCMGPEVASTDRTNSNGTFRAESFATEVPYGLNGAAGHAIREAGVVTTTSAGTWTWNRSQNTSNAAATTVMAGTYAIIERIS